jgi:hypothetical protein
VASAVASGGKGGPSWITGGVGGAATASSSAIGAAVTSNATATGGAGPGGAGAAAATSVASGAGGNVDAHAATALPSGARVGSIFADASATVSGTASVTAGAVIGAAAPSFITPAQGVAFATGAPAAASTTAVVTANPIIAGAIGSSPFLALGELGGGYPTGGTGTETTVSALNLNVALSSTDLANDLVLGLYGGIAKGLTGVTAVSLNVTANGHDLLDRSFTSGADAAGYFDDTAVDLGSLAGSSYGNGSLNLVATLHVTTNAAGSGFYGGLIVTG